MQERMECNMHYFKIILVLFYLVSNNRPTAHPNRRFYSGGIFLNKSVCVIRIAALSGIYSAGF